MNDYNTTEEMTISSDDLRSRYAGRSLALGGGYFFTFANADGYCEDVNVKCEIDYHNGAAFTYDHEIIDGMLPFVLNTPDGSFRVDARFTQNDIRFSFGDTIEAQMAPVPFSIPSEFDLYSEMKADHAARVIKTMILFEIDRQAQVMAVQLFETMEQDFQNMFS